MGCANSKNVSANESLVVGGVASGQGQSAMRPESDIEAFREVRHFHRTPCHLGHSAIRHHFASLDKRRRPRRGDGVACRAGCACARGRRRVSCVCSASAASAAVPCPLSAHALSHSHSFASLAPYLPQPLPPILSDVAAQDLFKRVGRAHTYNPGETMIQQGKFSDSAIFIRKGTVNIIKDTKQVAQRGKGDLIGEVSRPTLSHRTAHVAACAMTCRTHE